MWPNPHGKVGEISDAQDAKSQPQDVFTSSMCGKTCTSTVQGSNTTEFFMGR